MAEGRHGAEVSGGGWRAVAAWTVIWVLAALMAFSAAIAPAVEEATPDEQPGLEWVIAGRYAVGLAQLAEQSPELQDGMGQALAALPQAQRPVDHLRVAILAGELQNAGAALAQLKTLQATQNLPEPVAHDAEVLRTIYARGSGELPPDARSRLIDRHGWFGRLALAFNQPAAMPMRQQAMQAAARTTWTLLLGTMGLLGLGVVGLVMFLFAVVRQSQGKVRWRYMRTRRQTTPFLEAMALYLAALVAASFIVEGVGPAGLVAVVVLPLVVLLWPRVRGVTWPRLAAGLGWYRGEGVLREMAMGVVGYLAGVPVLALGLAGTVLLSAWLGEEGMHPVVPNLLRGGPVVIAGVLALAVLWAPVVEESFFRGALYHHLRRRWRVIGSALLVGVLFAVIHPQGIVGVPVIASLGIVLAVVREWRGSIIGPMTAHALHNLTALLVVLLLVR